MILLTGGTGLIGSHLLVELLKTESSVRAIYRDPARIQNVKKLFDYYSIDGNHNFDSIEWVKADVLDLVSLEDAFVGVTHVYHCAAIVSFGKRDFSKMMKINREGTNNMLNLSLANSIKKFAHVSSTAAIGGIEGKLTTEQTKWTQSPRISGYAVTKYSSEKEVWRAHEEGLDVVIINPSVIIGAGSWDESSMTIFKSIEKGLKFHTPGQNAFVDARDVARMLIQLMNSDIKNERFLCISENVPFKVLFQKIANQLNIKGPTIATPKWLIGFTWRLVGFYSWLTRQQPTITKETAHSAFSTMEYSNEKIKQALNVEFISVDDAIENAVRFHRKD